MHAAEHRALRELYAAARQLARHWTVLRERGLGADVLAAGAADAVRLADEVQAEANTRGLAIGAAAGTAGATLAGGRSGSDRFLERNQALRLAVLDASHLVTLLDYVAAVATDEQLSAFSKRWAARFRDHERTARDAVVALAAERDAAIARLDGSPLGRAAQGVANGIGTLGEWLDTRLPR